MGNETVISMIRPWTALCPICLCAAWNAVTSSKRSTGTVERLPCFVTHDTPWVRHFLATLALTLSVPPGDATRDGLCSVKMERRRVAARDDELELAYGVLKLKFQSFVLCKGGVKLHNVRSHSCPHTPPNHDRNYEVYARCKGASTGEQLLAE